VSVPGARFSAQQRKIGGFITAKRRANAFACARGHTRSRGQNSRSSLEAPAWCSIDAAGHYLAPAARVASRNHHHACCRCCLSPEHGLNLASSRGHQPGSQAKVWPDQLSHEQGLNAPISCGLLQTGPHCSHHGDGYCRIRFEALPEGGSLGWGDPRARSPGHSAMKPTPRLCGSALQAGSCLLPRLWPARENDLARNGCGRRLIPDCPALGAVLGPPGWWDAQGPE